MSNHRPSTTLHILLIPGEVRNQIYSHLVVFHPTPVPIYRESSTNSPGLAATIIPLFLTCRQFHREASALFYSQNKFALPSTASRAPHQAQVNLLFRWFLDRVDPRNAALIRHIAIPFPVDPAEFMRGHFAGSKNGCLFLGEEDMLKRGSRSLIPALAGRCPRLETVELDIRWNNHWVRLLCPHGSTARAMLGELDEELRAAFPALKQVRLRVVKSEREPRWEVTGLGLQAWDRMSPREWGWMRRVLEESVGWSVTFGEEEEDAQQEEGSTPAWTATWYPNNPLDTRSLLLLPHEMALQSETGDRYTALDLLKADLRFVAAWLRSPSRMIYTDTEAGEWREWKRTMVARARSVRTPLKFVRTSSRDTFPRASRTESIKRGMRGLLAPMR